MPAFDFTSFFVQSVWLSLGFVVFYIVTLKLLLPNLFFAIRLKKKIYKLKTNVSLNSLKVILFFLLILPRVKYYFIINFFYYFSWNLLFIFLLAFWNTAVSTTQDPETDRTLISIIVDAISHNAEGSLSTPENSDLDKDSNAPDPLLRSEKIEGRGPNFNKYMEEQNRSNEEIEQAQNASAKQRGSLDSVTQEYVDSQSRKVPSIREIDPYLSQKVYATQEINSPISSRDLVIPTVDMFLGCTADQELVSSMRTEFMISEEILDGLAIPAEAPEVPLIAVEPQNVILIHQIAQAPDVLPHEDIILAGDLGREVNSNSGFSGVKESFPSPQAWNNRTKK